AALKGDEHPLWRVERDRVGALDAAQPPSMFVRERERAAVGRVYVEPESVLAGDVGQIVQGVYDAGRGRARRACDAERRVALCEVAGDGIVQPFGANVKARVGLDLPQILAAEPEDVHALDEGVVALLRGVDDELSGRALPAH